MRQKTKIFSTAVSLTIDILFWLIWGSTLVYLILFIVIGGEIHIRIKWENLSRFIDTIKNII